MQAGRAAALITMEEESWAQVLREGDAVRHLSLSSTLNMDRALAPASGQSPASCLRSFSQLVPESGTWGPGRSGSHPNP